MSSKEIYQPGQVRAIFKYVPPDCKLFVLAGPADGSEAQEFHEQFPEIQIVGFEPNPVYFALQRSRSFPGRLSQEALWSTNGLDLPFSDQGRSTRHVDFSSPNTPLSFTAKSLALADVKEAKRCDGKIALWADVERAELEVLQGAKPLFEGRKICLTYLELFNSNYDQVARFLNAFGLAEVGRYNKFPKQGRFDALFLLEKPTDAK